MAWTKYQGILALIMVITGSINTISTKWADRMTTKDPDGKDRHFNHPFVQAISMFFGEILCIIVFKIIYFSFWRKHDGSHNEVTILQGNRNFNQFWLLAPAMCDMCATSIMYIGLNLTYASSFQMLRGAVIVFTGILSVIFLRRRLGVQEWIGILFVICGLTVVGLSDMVVPKPGPTPHNSTMYVLTSDDHSTRDIILGDLLIIGAQLITAVQVVLEEKFVAGLDIPALQAVGWEGIFGFTVLGLLQIPFYYIYVPSPFGNNPRHVLEDVLDAFSQMAQNNSIIAAITGTIMSIAFFNFAGISVTKELSSTTRMVLDSVRTLVIWIFSLSLGWQSFHYLQIIGFILLLIGMCLYNNIIIMPLINKISGHCSSMSATTASEDREGLINHPADETPTTQ